MPTRAERRTGEGHEAAAPLGLAEAFPMGVVRGDLQKVTPWVRIFQPARRGAARRCYPAAPVGAYVESFLPLFVAINLPGILPIFLGLTEGSSAAQRRRLVMQALLTAAGVSLLILFAGHVIFRVMGITVNDLRVGGGLILLTLSIADLIFGDYRRRDPTDGMVEGSSVGVVPLGIPLIVGPAAITTILVSQQSFGYLPTLVALVANLLLVFVGLALGPWVTRLVGSAVAKAVAKVASLFLAAIAVAMIRSGILAFIAAAR